MKDALGEPRQSADLPDPAGTPARIRVAVCGEVNSGKSTVLNTLLRAPVLPDNLGQEQRPQISVLHRARPGIEVVFPGGHRKEFGIGCDAADLRGAARVILWSDAPQFQGFEFVEIPMTTADAITEEDLALMRSVDVLIWVTIASQAWRLTEKSILGRFGKALPDHALIMVSRADKLRSDRDKEKLRKRIQRETAGLFSDLVFLNGARRTITDSATSTEVWYESGAPDLLALLQGFSERIGRGKPGAAQQAPNLIDLSDFRSRATGAAPAATGGGKPARTAKAEAAKAEAPASPETAQEDPAPQPEREETGATPAADAGVANLSPEAGNAASPALPETAPAADAAAPVAEVPVAAAPLAAPPAPPPDPALIAEMGAIFARLSGETVSGLLAQGGDGACTAFSGDPQDCARVGAACLAAHRAVTAAYEGHGLDADVGAVLLDSAGTRLAYDMLPGIGLVFLSADARRVSPGIAQSLMSQVRRLVAG